MDFTISEEQKNLLEKVREFCAQYCSEEQVREWIENKQMPNEVTRAYLDYGFGWLGIPEEYGGTPVSKVTFALIIEELHRNIGAVTPFVFNSATMYDICEFGTPEQIKLGMDGYKKEGRPPFALAISEPDAGSDNSNMRTTAKEVDGKIVINGTKLWVTNALTATHMLVFAKDEEPSPQNKNISIWVVPTDRKGVKITTPFQKIGQLITVINQVDFVDVVVEPTDLLGQRGKGFEGLFANFNFERLMACARSVGLMQACQDDASVYVNKRKTFGKYLYEHGMIQEKLADIEIKIQTARNFVYRIAWMMDQGMPTVLEVALAKRYCSIGATEVASSAMQIMGGYGYTNESRISRIFLDARGGQFAAGTDEIMAYLAGRQIAKKYRQK